MCEGKSKNVLWFELVNTEFNGKKNLFGVVYIPPENSPYSNNELFDVISEDLIKLDPQNDKAVCIFGDFNARVGCKCDILLFDDNVAESCKLDNNCKSFFGEQSKLIEMGFSATRNAEDKVVNNYGNKVLSICKTQCPCIVNGRAGNDRLFGNLTCKNQSTVDLVLASPSFFPLFSKFCVLDFDPVLSDVHSPVEFSILVNDITENNDSKKDEVDVEMKKPTWNDDIASRFVIDDNKIIVLD